MPQKCFKSIYRLHRLSQTVCGWSSFRRSHGCYMAPVNQRPSRLRAQFWNSTPQCGSCSKHSCQRHRFIAIFSSTRGLCVQIYSERCWELVHSLSFQNRASHVAVRVSRTDWNLSMSERHCAYILLIGRLANS
jgi:hypothetical protein